MNLHEIELLLQRYFEGETSLEEEKQLRDFFSREEVPEKWKGMAAYFGVLREERQTEMTAQLLGRIQEKGGTRSGMARIFDLQRPWIYWASGIAASLLITAAFLVRFDPFTRPIENTYQDPQMAYQEAKKILFFVSDKLNRGTSRLQPVATFETGLNSLKPVGSFSQSVDEISRLDQVEKANRLITRN